MAISSSAKLRRRAAKAKKRTLREKARLQRLANPPMLAPADLHLYWVLSGDSLEGRPGPLFSPGPAPTEAKPGRWISRRHLRVDDVLMLEGDDRCAIVVSLPDRREEPPILVELKRVERVFHNPPARLMCIHLGDQVIRATHAHRFWVHDRGWVPAEELNIGDQLRGPSGELVPVTGVFDNGEIEPVYNLRVADNFTYFVATPDRGQSVLVHNEYTILPNTDAQGNEQFHDNGRIRETIIYVDPTKNPPVRITIGEITPDGQSVQRNVGKNGAYRPSVPLADVETAANRKNQTASDWDKFFKATTSKGGGFLPGSGGAGLNSKGNDSNRSGVQPADPANGLTAAERATADLAGKLRFTETAGRHMTEAGRFVPRNTLADAILNGTRMADPQGAPGAIKIVQNIIVNGKEKVLEIIYRESDNTILHFLYK